MIAHLVLSEIRGQRIVQRLKFHIRFSCIYDGSTILDTYGGQRS